MIKVVELLVRRPGMTRSEFHDYWRNVHGPLVMSIPEIRRHNVKYVQSHTRDEWHPFLAGAEPLFDGAAEIWLDSLESALQLFGEPSFEELVVPDEEQFLDRSRTEILVMTEHLVHHRPGAPVHGGVKLFEIPVRPASITRADCHRHWLDVHGPMVLDTPTMVSNLRRYVQSHSIDDAEVPMLPPMRYDGLAELWFDTPAELSACFGDEYLATVHVDEPNFVDLDRSTAFLATEHLVYERPA